MKVSNSKGIASHADPEPCADGSNPTGEALAGERAGRVLSHEMHRNFRAPTRSIPEEGKTAEALVRVSVRLCVVGDLVHAPKHPERESGEPVPARWEDGTAGCVGKPKGVSQ